MPIYTNVAIVGVGLIGGSIGLALRKRGLAKNVTGVGRNQSTLAKALGVGAIDQAATDWQKGLAKAEIVVVATPVAIIAEHVCRALDLAKNASLVTDAGSTKLSICEEVAARASGKSSAFIGSHPLAGDHRTGPEHSREDLFAGRMVVVTPTENTATQLTHAAQDFWQALGAEVEVMSPAEHDKALAITSHLPHLVASALANVTPQDYLPLTATGWADSTRIAAGDPDLWAQIFSHNSAAIVAALDQLLIQLQEMRSNIVSHDWADVKRTLQQAKNIRDALGN